MSKLKRFFLLFILIWLQSCQFFYSLVKTPDTILPEPTQTIDFTPTPTLVLPEVSTPKFPGEDQFVFRYHPDGGVYVGDRVSFEIIPPEGTNLDGVEVQVFLNQSDTTPIAQGGFGDFGIGGRYQATFYWPWDTSTYDPGEYDLRIFLESQGESWNEPIRLFPKTDRPDLEKNAKWSLLSTDCCEIHYITHTAADRDLENLADIIEQQAEFAMEKMGVTFTDSIPIILLPRLLGHGGFAGGEIFVSYLDRNYAGSSIDQVIKHEMIHILDGRLGGEYRPTFFVEGLAVYISGGHFKKEPLLPRSEAVKSLNMYLPLEPLANNFYFSQHEISYLEAGAVIDYMVSRWGWEAFNHFYRDIKPPEENQTPSDVISNALKNHFDISIDQLEKDFLRELSLMPVFPDLVEDVQLTVSFFDTLRKYQQILDPSAYFLTAWMPSLAEMESQKIVADYFRHPSNVENLAIETMLIQADWELQMGRFDKASLLLSAVNMVLDAYKKEINHPFRAHYLAENYLAVASALKKSGYLPQKIMIDGDSAIAMVGDGYSPLVALNLALNDGVWQIITNE